MEPRGWRGQWPGADGGIEEVSERLREVRGGLAPEARRVYAALQGALHGGPGTGAAASPDFHVRFREALAAEFQEALQLSVRQLGSSCQWAICVNGGREIFCSVRLEVLDGGGGVAAGLLRELRSRARVVREVLLERGARWRRALTDGGAGQALQHFHTECEERARQGLADSWAGAGQAPARALAGAGAAEPMDALSAELGLRVVVSFECEACRHTWSTFNARLKPDNSVRTQYCGKCGGAGLVMNSRRYEDADASATGGWQQRAHQSSLCSACREFGTCTGIFYDPFVVSTALSLTIGGAVQWFSYSAGTPELLVADLGPHGTEQLQIFLQPHIYDPGAGERASASIAGASPPTARSQRGGSGPQRALPAPRAQGSGRQHGVKDVRLFQGFLSAMPGPRWVARAGTGPAGGEPRAGAAAPPFLPQAATEALPPPPPPPKAASQAFLGLAPAPDADPRWAPAAGAGWTPPPGGTPAEGRAPHTGGRNKIGATAAPPEPAAPRLLDGLPALRRAQLLQAALCHVRASGQAEAESVALAECHLVGAAGDFDRAFRSLQALTGTLATAEEQPGLDRGA